MKIALNWKWDLHNTRKIKVKSLFQGLAHFSFQMGLLFRYIDIRKDSSREKKRKKKRNHRKSFYFLAAFGLIYFKMDLFWNIFQFNGNFSSFFHLLLLMGIWQKNAINKNWFQFFFRFCFLGRRKYSMDEMNEKKKIFLGEIRDPEIAVIFSFFS